MGRAGFHVTPGDSHLQLFFLFFFCVCVCVCVILSNVRLWEGGGGGIDGGVLT